MERLLELKTPLNDRKVKSNEDLAIYETEGKQLLAKFQVLSSHQPIDYSFRNLLLMNEIEALLEIEKQGLIQNARIEYGLEDIHFPQIINVFKGFLKRSYPRGSWMIEEIILDQESPDQEPIFGFTQTNQGVEIEKLLASYDQIQPHHLPQFLAKFAILLASLEKSGIMHGDIKPKQLIVEPATGDCTLIDFESAKSIINGQFKPFFDSIFLNDSNFLAATVQFASPEQIYDYLQSLQPNPDPEDIQIVYQFIQQQRALGAKIDLKTVNFADNSSASDLYSFALVCLYLRKNFLFKLNNLTIEHLKSCLELNTNDRPTSHELASNLLPYLD